MFAIRLHSNFLERVKIMKTVDFCITLYKQGLKSLNPRPNSLFCTNSWCPTSMQNLESVAQKMAEL